MNITATLLAQIVAFVLLIWFVNKYLWGPLTTMMAQRQKRIDDGLAASEKGKHELELAEKGAMEKLRHAKQQAAEIIAQSEKRASEIVDEAKVNARAEGERLLTAARAEIDQEANRVREELRSTVAAVAVAGAGKILGKEISESVHADLMRDLAKQI